jgi:hypothetical protein
MYLVKDGKCIQSFKNADFDAVVEKLKGEDVNTTDSTKGFKQEWNLNYTSLQNCSTDSTKNFVVNFKGVCKEADDKFETSSTADCAATVTYTGKNACYKFYVPMQKYMSMVAPFTGAIFIIVGIIMCFYGSKFLPFMIAFLVGLGVTGAISLIGYNFLNPEQAEMWHFIVLILFALVFGIIGGICIFKLAEAWGVPILSFWLGILLGLFCVKLAGVQN